MSARRYSEADLRSLVEGSETPLAVVRRGRVIAETPPRVSRLQLEGRPDAVDPASYSPAV